ncbi:nitroreductase family protein [Actinophytocola sp. KF-1]
MDDYEQFWTAGRLTRLTQRRMTERLAEHRSPAGTLDPFTLPTGYHPLARPAGPMRRWYVNRRSGRSFSRRAMTARTLGVVLDTLSATPDGRRAHPSAGGLNPLRCYPVLLNVRHPLNGHVTRYDPDRHALQAVGPAPGWPELAPLLGAAPDGPSPAIAMVFVLADEPVLAKYGQRGGRFGLIEVGAATQNIALCLARHRLAGHLLGGAVDADVLALAGLRGQPVRFAVAAVCGHPG